LGRGSIVVFRNVIIFSGISGAIIVLPAFVVLLLMSNNEMYQESIMYINSHPNRPAISPNIPKYKVSWPIALVRPVLPFLAVEILIRLITTPISENGASDINKMPKGKTFVN